MSNRFSFLGLSGPNLSSGNAGRLRSDKAKLSCSGDLDAGHGAVEWCWGPFGCMVWPGRSLVLFLCFDARLVKMLVVLTLEENQKEPRED